MMLSLAWRLLFREWTSGELSALFAALVIAIAAMTTVAFLTDRVGHAINLRAAASLAADLRLDSSQPLADSYRSMAHRAGLETASMVSMPSVIFHGEHSTLASVHAVTRGYPLRGSLKTAEKLLGPAAITVKIPGSGEAWATTHLLARLGVDTGATIQVGSTRLKVTRVLAARPDEGWRFVDLAPGLLINGADLENTRLVQPGSRISYRLLLAGSRRAINRFKPDLQARLAAGEKLSDVRDTNPQIRSAMERSGRFLNLASMISVLLAALAVAMASRRYALRHRDRVALLKCLGSQQSFILRLNLLQLLILALLSAATGIVLGYVSQQGLAFIARDLIAQPLPPAGLAPALLGLMTALLMLFGFALPDLIQMCKTPVLRVLRQDVEPPPMRYGLSYIAGAVSILVLLQWLLRDFKLVVGIAAGASIALSALGLAGWLLVKLTARFRGAAGISWRYGLANLNRRGRESVVLVVAFGLGLMVLMLLTLVRNDLMASWLDSLPGDAPNQFMINIQPADIPPLKKFLIAQGLEVPLFVPLVRARMTAINHEPVERITFKVPQGERWARRESNLSFTDTLPPGNHLVKGQWWHRGSSDHEVSLEVKFGQDLGVKLGDELSFDIAGEAVTATVTSFRRVEWDTFTPNFFMQFSPVTLLDFPVTYISSLYISAENAPKVLRLMQAFPSVTVIDLGAMLSQVRAVMDKAALAIEAVFTFTLLAGLAILWAAVQAARDERLFESAVLRTLGASRRQVRTAVVSEFLAIGLLAGLLASIAAGFSAWYLAVEVFGLQYHFNLLIGIFGPLAGMLLVGLSGALATRSVVTHTPVSILRSA